MTNLCYISTHTGGHTDRYMHLEKRNGRATGENSDKTNIKIQMYILDLSLALAFTVNGQIFVFKGALIDKDRDFVFLTKVCKGT